MNFGTREILEVGALTYFTYRLYREFSLKGMFRHLNRIPLIRDRIDQQVDKQLGKVKPGLIDDRFKHVDLPTDPAVMRSRTMLQDEPMEDA